MTRSFKSSVWGINNLVNFNLVVDERRLMISSEDLSEIEFVKKFLEKMMPKYCYIIENFSVALESKMCTDQNHENYQKTSGYSLWQILK